ncbi:hypothetical protein QL285_008794 [Trifolium repens]|nr:hypothetical protein QL285_008794 [Trifolium repens]
MEKRLSAINQVNFETTYGSILDLLHVKVDVTALTTQAQLFDSPLSCFIFQDFQLSPTITEFEKILGPIIEGQVCYMRETPTEEDIAKALHLKQEEISSLQASKCVDTLEAKAQEELSNGNWKAHNAILALLIYSLVLFPSRDNFVSMSAVAVFLTRNPVPTLLADYLYSLCDRRSVKKGDKSIVVFL